jgi:hypothetical protein
MTLNDEVIISPRCHPSEAVDRVLRADCDTYIGVDRFRLPTQLYASMC